MRWAFCILSLMANVSYAALPVCQQVCSEFKVKTWKDYRDSQVVKQDFDFSCGAAALATLLNGFYGQSYTEPQILEDMNKQDGKASFIDMARVVQKYGFQAQGLALDYSTLSQLKVPVIVYLEHRKDSHFSVLNGISESHVQLADPSWGNRVLSKQAFLTMWETRSDALAKGKILVISPKKTVITQSEFWKHPQPNILLKQSILWLKK
ncbi:MAG: C39 family peptidase [Moraxellaceae bacterium]|jgi:predicted double-glycine peptidase|nr:C39 family peptidase [Moraxellaceae bacterium]